MVILGWGNPFLSGFMQFCAPLSCGVPRTVAKEHAVKEHETLSSFTLNLKEVFHRTAYRSYCCYLQSPCKFGQTAFRTARVSQGWGEIFCPGGRLQDRRSANDKAVASESKQLPHGIFCARPAWLCPFVLSCQPLRRAWRLTADSPAPTAGGRYRGRNSRPKRKHTAFC